MIDDTVYKDICNEIKRLKKHYRIYAYQNAVLINFNKSIDSYQKQIKDAIRCLK